MLDASGITPEHAARRGYETITSTGRLTELNITKAGRLLPGLLVPQLRADGSTWGYQYRPDTPRLREGKPVKYETPVGQRNGLDVPPGVGHLLGDPAVPLWITEGVKKADCGALRGLCVVALPGVWSWRGRNGHGGRAIIPDWHDVALNGRRVVLAFDGDVARKPPVRRALEELADYLESKDAHVEYLHLPDTDDKTGLDDFLVGNAVEDLWRLVKPDPPGGSAARDDDGEPAGSAGGQQRLDDAHIAQYLAEYRLADKFCWCSSLGWMRYTSGYWERTTDATVVEQVRLAAIKLHGMEARSGADADRLKAISGLFAAHRLRAVTNLTRGILEVAADQFDRHPELLAARNGVVNLETGELLPHNPRLLLTKHTLVEYHPGAMHPDWDAALAALPPEVRDWMQRRIGQAATGHPTPDDVLPVLLGSGANGKSTLLAGIMRALGDYAVAVPERVLLANPGDHPTELMTLRGARLAVIEETPEARHLNVKRLKDVLGTEVMTARYIAKDVVSWSPVHSLILTTNYRPRVDETDHGTWRRLALVRFPYTYRNPGDALRGDSDREGDPTLRQRMRHGGDGRHEAVLAWIVRGALAWHRDGRVLPPPPPTVERDTWEWRAEADAVLAFVAECMVFEPDAHVRSTELFATFSEWLKGRGHQGWSDQTFAARFGAHQSITSQGVEYRQISATESGLSRPPGILGGDIPKRYRAWCGIRFRKSSDDFDAETEIDAEPEAARTAQHQTKVPRKEPNFETTNDTVQPVHKIVPKARRGSENHGYTPRTPGARVGHWIGSSEPVQRESR